MTLLPSASLLRVSGMHTTSWQRSIPYLIGGHQISEKLNIAQQVTATLTPPTVNMMSHNDWCFVCSKAGHIRCHCHNVQCYNCYGFGHFAQDFPEKISLSGTPYHHDRSCFPPCHDHNHRDRLQSLHYRCSQGRCLNPLGSHH